MQVTRKINVPPGQWKSLKKQPMIKSTPSKQNNTFKALIGREQNAAQSNRIIPKHAPTNKVMPPPGQ